MHLRTALLALSWIPAVMASTASAQVVPGSVPGTFQGPSSSQTPYVVPQTTAPGWQVVSLISAGDASKDGYRMVGIPDGLGALAGKFEAGHYVADHSYMTVFMNHEIPIPNPPSGLTGLVRAHGARGAFVSQWTIHLNTLQIKKGEDLIRRVFTWDSTGLGQYVETTAAEFSRFCSADLPAATAFFNPRSGKGFSGRIYMNGEEISDGRAFAHVVSGQNKGVSYQLPHLGRFAWENAVAHPHAGDKTVVVGFDDSTPGNVYVYVGDKRASGNPVERAGLVGGKLWGIRVTDGGANYPSDHPLRREYNGPINGTFDLVDMSDVAVGPGAALQSTGIDRNLTEFARPEDGAWDTQDPRVLYFVVTGANIRRLPPPAPQTTPTPPQVDTNPPFPQSARLYKLTFNSVINPTGGTIELVVDRAALHANPVPPPTEPLFAQFDNITVAGDGSVVVLEDPGDVPYIARAWLVNPHTKTAQQILGSDPARFLPPTPTPFNQDEESSGVIDVTDIVRSANWFDHDRRYFLADLQAHYLTPDDPELVEGGQLYLFMSPRRAHGGKKDK